MPPLPITLISTNPPGFVGSMARYERMVSEALARHGQSRYQITIVHLALRDACLRLVPQKLRTHFHHAWIKATVRTKLAGIPAALFHCLDGSHAYSLGQFKLKSQPYVCTSHDLIPLLQMERQLPGGKPGQLGQRIIRQSVAAMAASAQIIAVSRSTSGDLTRLVDPKIATKISVVYSALEPNFSLYPLPKGGTPRGVGAGLANEPFILHLGNNAFYKNRLGTLAIFARLADILPLRLVMAGPPPNGAVLELVSSLALGERVDFVTHPSDQQVWDLYQNAQLLLFPSLYEGFGWPPLEAMAAGCPVVCSNVASLPEVVGDAALMAPPDDESALANHCRRILTDPALAASMVAKGKVQAAGFTLERMAQGLMAAYDAALVMPGSGALNPGIL